MKGMICMTYGYARVSTKEQNLDRQLKALQEYGIDERAIYTDKMSGKNFNRPAYNALVGTENTMPTLREGDLLVILSLDRLGRDYTEVKEQWEHITKKLKADIKVLDMPMLDTSQSNDSLDKRFIADLVLQILSYTAQKERENTLKRQRQGIDAMPTDENGKKVSVKTGKAMGRPTTEIPENFETVYNSWKSGKITAVKAFTTLNLTKATFYRIVKQYENR